MSDDGTIAANSASALLTATLKHNRRRGAAIGGAWRVSSPALTVAVNGLGLADVSAADIEETARIHGISEFAVVRELYRHGVISSPAATMQPE